MKRTRIKPQSHTARTIANQRRQLAKRHHTPPRCTIPNCPNPAVDHHEPHTRARGGDPTDPFNMKPLCRQHHDRVDADPRWAESLGLLVSQYASQRDTVGPMTTQRGVRWDDNLLARIDRVAEAEKRSFAVMVQILAAEALDHRQGTALPTTGRALNVEELDALEADERMRAVPRSQRTTATGRPWGPTPKGGGR